MRELLTDCPHCHVESALVELMDGRASIESRCHLCGYATALDEQTAFGQPFLAEDDVVEALERWAAEDGEKDVAVFTRVNFNSRTPSQVAALVLAGERVDTGFDVIAYLFPGMAGGSTGRAVERQTIALVVHPAVAAPAPDPRDIARALVSMMLADGHVVPAEEAFLAATLERMGAPPLDPRDRRVWRPNELGPVADPAAVIEAMRVLALVDDDADGTERRVLREYARAWHVPLPANPFPSKGALAGVGRAVAGLFVR